MFWSPTFGSSLLAKNWSAYAANSIVAEFRGTDSWEDYWTVESKYDTAAGTAQISARMIDLPLTVERQYHFGETSVDCQLTISSDSDVTVEALWHCLPYFHQKRGGIEVVLLDAGGNHLRVGPAQGIQFRSTDRQSHVAVFSRPLACHDGTDEAVDAYGAIRQHRRVLMDLPLKWKAGERWRLRWRIMSVASEDVPRAVSEAVKELGES